MKCHSVFAAALVLAAAVTAQAQTVKVEFLMGKVNITAQNASKYSLPSRPAVVDLEVSPINVPSLRWPVCECAISRNLCRA